MRYIFEFDMFSWNNNDKEAIKTAKQIEREVEEYLKEKGYDIDFVSINKIIEKPNASLEIREVKIK